MKAVKKLINEYKARIENYDTLIAAESERLRIDRSAGAPNDEQALQRADIRRLNDLRQLCIQMVVDLESLEEAQ